MPVLDCRLNSRYTEHMAQIFVSHSGRDGDLRSFFSEAFAGTKVKAVFEEFEKLIRGTVTSQQITKDIEASKAVFTVLSENVENIPHTRDWVVWEVGVAKNKDIWVFEPYSHFGRVSVVTPHLKHYVLFDLSDAWRDYIRRIVESYDDSHVLPAMLVAGGLGALAIQKRLEGAALGAMAGIMMSDKSRIRPQGTGVMCVECSSTYDCHLPKGMNTFRCPVCNTVLEINLTDI